MKKFVLPVVLGLFAVPALAQQATEKQQLDAYQAQASNAVAALRITVDDRDGVITALSQQNQQLKDNLASMTKDRDSVKSSNDTLTKQVADLQGRLDTITKEQEKK